jgi:dimethylargininase
MGAIPKNQIIAITHAPSPYMDRCELTYVARSSIDHKVAVRQHREYCAILERCGAEVHVLDVNLEHPDCVFIEDTSIVLDEVAILTSMGTPSRRSEPPGIEPALKNFRQVEKITLPAAIEGGDIARVGRTLLAGLSSRTNSAGISALQDLVRKYGYEVRAVPIRDCLHLKSACTALPDGRLLVNPNWLETAALEAFQYLPIPSEEPWAADILSIGHTVCMAANHPRTADLVNKQGFPVEVIDLSEFAKAEGGVTCLSLVFDRNR